MIGQQSFRLHILSNDRAQLEIQGLLSVKEMINYEFSSQTGFVFTLTEALRKTLRQFRTSLVQVGYDSVRDVPYVIVAPPLPTKIRISLLRLAD